MAEKDLWSDDDRAATSSADQGDLPEILTTGKKLGIEVTEKKSAADDLETRSECPTCDGTGELDDGSDCPDCDGTGEIETKSAKVVPPVRPRSIKKPRHRSGPSTGLEVRNFSANGLELRDDGSNNLQLVGMPIIYDTPYLVRDMFGTFNETMKPGVVTDLLKNGCDTRFLFNHSGLPLARTTSGTLILKDSPKGLTCIANLDARQQLANDLAVAVERGDVTQMSIGMMVGDDEWPDNETRNVFRLKALEDVSPVTYPASPTTSIAVAQRMLSEMPVESRERVRRMWAITRDLHDNRTVTKEDIDLLSDGLRALAEADEVTEPRVDVVAAEIPAVHDLNEVAERILGEAVSVGGGTVVNIYGVPANNAAAIADEVRAEPTPQDKTVTSKLAALALAHHDVVQAQMADTDNATDASDQELMGHLQNIGKLIGKAQATQAVDSASDIPAGTLAGPQGDSGAGASEAEVGAQDGTRNHKPVAERYREYQLDKIRRDREERDKRKNS